ncbi:MAG TPA: cadherin-like domain-containing protein [Caldilineaceae bacterium]|nr:cadherin-like domain-containing protein [Caldilineaceae bacterium]
MNNRWRSAVLGGLVVGGIILSIMWLPTTSLSWVSASVTTLQAQPVQTAADPLDGVYSGAVELEWTLAGVYTDPLPTPAPPATAPELGGIDLALQLTQTGNSLTGYVDLAQTLIFTVEHTVNGAALGPAVNGTFDGVNLTLESERIDALIAGRTVERQFRLTGVVVGDDPAKVSGQYRETLWGYAQQPITVLGSFNLQRPVFNQAAPDTSNQAPDVVADTATTKQGAAVTVNVLANDTDGNSDALTLTAVSKPQFGKAVINGGSVVYTPNAAFIGADTFSYVVSDGKGEHATGAVTVTVTDPNGSVNQPPTAGDDTATTNQGVSVLIPVLVNDTDPDGDALTLTIDGLPRFGTATVENGQIRYTPNTNFVGTESFRYIVADGKGGTARATVTVTVTPTSGGNRPPTAVNDQATTPPNTPITINVLGNDADPDGDPLTITINTPPSHGTATVEGNQIRYTPEAGFVGTDSFTYIVADGKGGATIGMGIVTVTDQPGGGGDLIYLPLVQR